MRRTLYLIGALIAGAAIASALRIDAGYVAISFLGVLIEMSVVTLFLLILATFLLLWLLVRLVRLRKLRREAQAARRKQRARLDLARGVLELAEGNWPTAEITVTRSARDDVQPAVNYLIAARAADLQGAHERRAGWLRMDQRELPSVPYRAPCAARATSPTHLATPSAVPAHADTRGAFRPRAGPWRIPARVPAQPD